jgi:hypothetical protein
MRRLPRIVATGDAVKIALVVLAACGTTATAPVNGKSSAPAPTVAVAHFQPMAALDRPDVDITSLLPDPTEHGRWPLNGAQHPSLEPTFAIAEALAQPGVHWEQLCESGADRRHLSGNNDLSDYLGAWCSVLRHDTTDALYRLGMLHHSSITGLADATKHDCADILVDRGNSDEVERLLRTNGMLDVPTVDIVAAAYFEVGNRDDAYQMNALAIQMDPKARFNAQCRRYARGAVTGHEWQIDVMIEQLQRAVDSDQTCSQLYNELVCWRTPQEKCEPYFANQQRSLGQLSLLETYLKWPHGRTDIDHWTTIIDGALKAEPVESGATLAVPALELAMRMTNCEVLWVSKVYDQTEALIAHVGNVRLELALGRRLNVLWQQIAALKFATHRGDDACRATFARLSR